MLGSPRSGTTLMGRYICTSPAVWDYEEYMAFEVLHYELARLGGEGPFPFRARYEEELREHAERFASEGAEAHGCAYYCDSTPPNLLVAEALAEERLQAIFVLCLRHYAGVLQSLERAYAEGQEWAWPNMLGRAMIWAGIYANVRFLPPERTVAFGYDRLCADPSATIEEFKQDWAALGFNAGELDDSVFSQSYAPFNRGKPRPTVAVSSTDQSLVTRSIHSFDKAAWTPEIEEVIGSVVEPVDRDLRRRFPGKYTDPGAG